MMMKPIFLVTIMLGSLLVGGCISSEETVYSDVPRVNVAFENDKAARIFYEALSQRRDPRRTESSVHVEIPIVFEDRRVGKSKMSRKIFMEALTMVWRLRAGGGR